MFCIKSLTAFNASFIDFGDFSFGSCFFFWACCCCCCCFCCFFFSSFSFVLCSFFCTLVGFLFSLFPSRLSYSVFTWLNGTKIMCIKLGKNKIYKSDLQKSSTFGAFSINFFFSAFVSLLDLSFLSFFLLTSSQLPDDIVVKANATNDQYPDSDTTHHRFRKALSLAGVQLCGQRGLLAKWQSQQWYVVAHAYSSAATRYTFLSLYVFFLSLLALLKLKR